MNVAGVQLPTRHAEALARLLEPSEPLARKLKHALDERSKTVELTIQERVRLLEALETARDEFTQLREALLEQFRRRDEQAARRHDKRHR